MNPVAPAAMLGIGLLVVGGLIHTASDGHPILLAAMACMIVAMYVRRG